MNGKLRVAGIGLALAVMAGLVLMIVRPSLDPARVRPLPLIIGAWLAFLAAAWLLRKVPRRTAVALILLGGIALQAAAVSAPPQYSTDSYRYIWDGRVQAAGIDPYQYVPAATQLTGLRNDFLFYPARSTASAATRRPNSPRAAPGSTGRPCPPSTRRSPRRTSSRSTTCIRRTTPACPSRPPRPRSPCSSRCCC